MRDGIRLREVHLSDAAALTALFQMPDVSKHLDPPPGNDRGLRDLDRAQPVAPRRRPRRLLHAAHRCKDEVTGLFMALRFEDIERAEIGFAIAPQLWGTGVFMKIDRRSTCDFLFNEWGVKTLIGKTQVERTSAASAPCARSARR